MTFKGAYGGLLEDVALEVTTALEAIQASETSLIGPTFGLAKTLAGELSTCSTPEEAKAKVFNLYRSINFLYNRAQHLEEKSSIDILFDLKYSLDDLRKLNFPQLC